MYILFLNPFEGSDYKIIANETLEELEWCLKQLENIQTKRPVSDMAFSKVSLSVTDYLT